MENRGEGGGYGNMGMKMIKVYCTHLKCQNETHYFCIVNANKNGKKGNLPHVCEQPPTRIFLNLNVNRN